MSELFLCQKNERRSRNLLTTTFLPVDGKADGSITCREQEEEDKDEHGRCIGNYEMSKALKHKEEDKNEQERCNGNYEMSEALRHNEENQWKGEFKEAKEDDRNFAVEQRHIE